MTSHHAPRIATVEIRPETMHDHSEITGLVVAAFNSKDESDLIEAIRDSPSYLPDLTLVAIHRDGIVGHVMVSRVGLCNGPTKRDIACLAPLAVAPPLQGRGIGSTLVRSAVERADASGEPMIVLEGPPRFYRRFGFVPASHHGIEMRVPTWAPPTAAQVLPLKRFDASMSGKVIFPSPFDSVVHP